jgi:glycosyltransferase involved in cell wall biosynthesis
MSKASLSILIPTYNGVCTKLVHDLYEQAERLGVDYEILVADDGSTQQEAIAANRSINVLPHCRFIECSENRGRAAIRNFLAEQSQYPWLLFIDCDMVVCRQDFIQQYITTACETIVDGGVVIGKVLSGNLRSMYEKAHEQEHTVERRLASPYRDFHTANFLIRRDIMLQCPFDIRYRHYGYEDVLFGKQMETKQISILHIDNPLSFETFETNAEFISKTEEGLRTLHQFHDELKGYSRLLDTTERVPKGLVRLWHRLFGKWERRQLTGSRPNLLVFNLYKLGYFVSL